MPISNNHYSIKPGKNCLWEYEVKSTNRKFQIGAPIFEIDGKKVEANWETDPAEKKEFFGPVSLYRFSAKVKDYPSLTLELLVRAGSSEFVRFKYVLYSDSGIRLTKNSGVDDLTYCILADTVLTDMQEIRLSEFDDTVHSYRLTENKIDPLSIDNVLSFMGPLIVASDKCHSCAIAYEHGSPTPKAYLRFTLEKGPKISLKAVKGNYPQGRKITQDKPFETIWFEFGAVEGDSDLLRTSYRSFILKEMSDHDAARKPYIFYNTWNFQERTKSWYGGGYLDPINEEHVLKEIDIAHRIGVDVFVIDTGWYVKTGDWRVNPARFPNGLGKVKERLDTYGMKLGLWFSPMEAAVSSQAAIEYHDCIATMNGEPHTPHKVWDTEESHKMCLSTRYWEKFADELIRVAQETGVTYFKWDAVGLYGCNNPNHDHGDTSATDLDRKDCYEFDLVSAMNRICKKITTACPEAIIDYDVTENGRTVGLAFLNYGKYFHVNNGPYFHTFDVPNAKSCGMGSNVFAFPGNARPRVCRRSLNYDRWIPSILFLTHYLPDAPYNSQLTNIASLILGHNGIWGDLGALTEEDIGVFDRILSRYKLIKQDITNAPCIFSGIVGGSPEIYEKIDPSTGKGVVVAFTYNHGPIDYITKTAVSENSWRTDNVYVKNIDSGKAVIRFDFQQNQGAQIVFFGVSK